MLPLVALFGFTWWQHPEGCLFQMLPQSSDLPDLAFLGLFCSPVAPIQI